MAKKKSNWEWRMKEQRTPSHIKEKKERAGKNEGTVRQRKKERLQGS